MASLGAGSVPVRFLGLMLVAVVLGLSRPAPAAAASVGDCELVVDRAALSGASSPDRAIEVAAGSVIDLAAVSNVPGLATVTIGFGPLASRVFEQTLQPFGTNAWAWIGQVDVSQYSTYGVGLYQVKATAGPCEVNGWVRLTGKAPYETPVGLAIDRPPRGRPRPCPAGDCHHPSRRGRAGSGAHRRGNLRRRCCWSSPNRPG